MGRPLARHPPGGVPGGGVDGQGFGGAGLGGAGGGGDQGVDVLVALAVLGAHQGGPVGIGLHPPDDAVHDRHRLDRIGRPTADSAESIRASAPS